MRSSVFWTCAGLRVFAAFCSIQVRTSYTCHSERSFANAKRSRRISDFVFVDSAEKIRDPSTPLRFAQDDNEEVDALTFCRDLLSRLRQHFPLSPRQAF